MSEILNTLMQDARVWQGHRHIQAGQPAEPTGYQVLDNQLGGIGWPRGALSECLLDAPGIGELHLLLPLMQRLSESGKTVFWLNPPHTPYAPALAREGVNLDQVVLINTEDDGDFLWTLENCLRSPVTGLVMAWPGKLAAREIRRLQLAAEAGSNVCVLFRERRYAEQNSPAALRLELAPGDQQDLRVNVLKRRGSWPGQCCSLAMNHRADLAFREAPGWFRAPGLAGAGRTHHALVVPALPHLLLDHIRRSRENQGALAVVDGSGQKVIQACPEARAQGVKAGMRLKTAISLVPELGMVRADHQQQARILEDQARWLYRYAAHIVLVPPDGLLAEVGSLQRLYGGLSAVWQTVEQGLNDRQLNAWIAVGHTPLAARLIARTGKGECSADKGHILRALGQMSLLAAEFDEKTRIRLQRVGLNTFGEVLALPSSELARRLSPETLAYVQKIQGNRADPQTPWQPPHHFRQQADFVQEIEQSQGLLFPLQRILSELEEDLCWRQQDTDSLLLVLQHRHQEPTRLRVRTSGPEHRAEAFLNLIRLRLEQHPLRAPVISLVLSVKRFIGREAAFGQDLLGETQDLNEAWHTLISRLQARLGDNALRQLSPQADHRPERAWSASEVLRRYNTRLPDYTRLPRRPLWLLKGPQPLTETPPVWLSGPERISGGWWDGQRVHRDYYIAQLTTGQLAWVFRDVRDGWFVHGWFS